MLERTEKSLDKAETLICRIAILLTLVSFTAFVLSSSVIPAFADHVLRLVTKFIF